MKSNSLSGSPYLTRCLLMGKEKVREIRGWEEASEGRQTSYVVLNVLTFQRERQKQDIGLGCPGPSSPLLVPDRPCPALHLTWCPNGLVPSEVVPESARRKEVITGSKTLLRGSRTWLQERV